MVALNSRDRRTHSSRSSTSFREKDPTNVEASPASSWNTGEGDPGEGSGDSGGPCAATSTSKGSWYFFPSYNNKTLDCETTTPLHLSRLLFSMVLFYLLHICFTPIGLLAPSTNLRVFHLSEPDSYPTHKTPNSTPEGPTTIDVAERRIGKNGRNEEY